MLHDGSQLLASEVTRVRLLMGVLPKELRDLEDFFGILTFVPVDETIVRVAAGLACRFRRSRSGIGTAGYVKYPALSPEIGSQGRTV